MIEDSQAGFALIAAAFMTGLWAWVAQKAKSKEKADELEINTGVQERETRRIFELESQILQLKEKSEECERVRQHLERENARLYREMNRERRRDDDDRGTR